MKTYFTINVFVKSEDKEQKVEFSPIQYGISHCEVISDIELSTSTGFPMSVKLRPLIKNHPITSIEYIIHSDMRNYQQVIAPDSGRNYMNHNQLVNFWSFEEETAINDFKFPLFIFTGSDLNTSLAFGIIGKNYESSFKTLEPENKRALLVYKRKLSLMIKRGVSDYPIPEHVFDKEDGSVTEYLYYKNPETDKSLPWVSTLREFSSILKDIYHIDLPTTDSSLDPMWCSWTDWFSNNITDEVIREQVELGTLLGIKNYIIDDGWFGPGLDNDWEVELNIGDWNPDPTKITDMKTLVRDIHSYGGKALIWCAPHGVAKGAHCFEDRKKYLIQDRDGNHVSTSNGFYSLCFMNPEARQIMTDICTSFIDRWSFDGAKFDLFNCVPPIPCHNQDHKHDTDSMMHGLELTLEQIYKACKQRNPDFIIELKQNYGTPFLSQYGTLTRAGDTPYDSEGNFRRSIFVQAYTPYTLNDYQTITSEDSPESAACLIIKMIAAGVPSYSIDFKRLNEKNLAVIKNYNQWYLANKPYFKKHRISLTGNNSLICIEDSEKPVYLMVNEGNEILLEKSATILNGTYREKIDLSFLQPENFSTTIYDCYGKKTNYTEHRGESSARLNAQPGCRIEVDMT